MMINKLFSKRLAWTPGDQLFVRIRAQPSAGRSGRTSCPAGASRSGMASRRVSISTHRIGTGVGPYGRRRDGRFAAGAARTASSIASQ
jgi:hypothetical protein